MVVSLLAVTMQAQNQQNSGPNSDPTYQKIRSVRLGTEVVSVKNLELKRQAATFHFHSGVVCFVTPVEGKVTGAVFVGNGNLVLDPPTSIERASLKLLTKQDEFVEHYDALVLRFSDATYEEIKRGGSPGGSGCDAGVLQDSQHAMRHDRTLKYNLDARILQDVLSSEPGGLFVAFVHGKRYDGKTIFAIDPHGERGIEPEEVELETYSDNKTGVWAAFHLAPEYANGTASSAQKNGVIRIEHQQ